jgi:4-hydroxybenzoate polyprenyltransferase
LPSYLYALETTFSLGIGAVFYLLDFVLIVAWAAIKNPTMARSFIGNLRLERIAYYFSLIALGAFVVARSGSSPVFINWVDVVFFACLALAFFSSFLFAIGVNDLADTAIDQVSNEGRPIPSGALTAADVSNGNAFFFSWSLLGGFLCGYWALFTVATLTAAYYIYSAPPLRLKRVPLLSSFLISIASLSALMAGFYFADANKMVSDLPVPLVALIVICITLAVNFKDLKDIAGDRADGIRTIPVVFGEERGKQITGTMLAMAFLIVPVILRSWMLFLPSLAAAIAGYLFITTKKYREWRIFAVYFIYIGVLVTLLSIYPGGVYY